MTISETQGAVKKFRKTSWQFQQTFKTPRKNLKPFVTAILSAHGLSEIAAVTIDNIVFEPKNLHSLLVRHSLPVEFGENWSLEASGRVEMEELLEAALGDWIDFIFVPTPKSFVIYADHDEYTTFFANTKANLNRVNDSIVSAGFNKIPNWDRKL